MLLALFCFTRLIIHLGNYHEILTLDWYATGVTNVHSGVVIFLVGVGWTDEIDERRKFDAMQVFYFTTRVVYALEDESRLCFFFFSPNIVASVG